MRLLAQGLGKLFVQTPLPYAAQPEVNLDYFSAVEGDKDGEGRQNIRLDVVSLAAVLGTTANGGDGTTVVVANTGGPYAINLPNSSIQLNGSGGDTYLWEFGARRVGLFFDQSGDTSTLASPSLAGATTPGIYDLKLTAIRNGVSDTKSTTVTVVAASGGGGGTTTFVTSIIPDNEVNPTSTTAGYFGKPKQGVKFTANPSEPATHVWSLTQVPSGSGIFAQGLNTTSAQVEYGAVATDGVYKIHLESTRTSDNVKATADYTLTVSGWGTPPPTMAPQANAGLDATITSAPGYNADSYQLQGSSTNPNNADLIYEWTIDAQPAGNTLAFNGSPQNPYERYRGTVAQGADKPVAIFLNARGQYVFRLRVTDPTNSLFSEDTVTITTA